MNRSLLASMALSLALIAAVVPGVLAADPAPSDSAAPSVAPATPAPGESATPSDPAPGASVTPPGDGTPPDGEISVDPTFITAAPSGAVLGATGTPDPTLPPTDAIAIATTPGGATLQALLIALAVVATIVLLAGRLPDARRR